MHSRPGAMEEDRHPHLGLRDSLRCCPQHIAIHSIYSIGIMVSHRVNHTLSFGLCRNWSFVHLGPRSYPVDLSSRCELVALEAFTPPG